MGFIQQPQSVWWRKALFQIHLWSGVVLGIYILVATLSGAALVFHWELEMATAPPVTSTATRVNYDRLKFAAERTHPGYRVTGFLTPPRAGSPAEVFLEGQDGDLVRFIHPVSGADLGPVHLYRPLAWLADLHVNLLAGPKGNIVNGAGGIALGLMCITGIVLWWPGVTTWRRALTVQWNSGWKRINFDLHSAVGFWTLSLVLGWAFTGAYFVFPKPFQRALSLIVPMSAPRETPAPPALNPGRPFASIGTMLQAAEKVTPGAVTTWIEVPHDDDHTQVRIIRHLIYEPWAAHHPSVYLDAYTGAVQDVDISLTEPGDQVQRWFGYLHFGNFAGAGGKVVWLALGLSPALLTVTGFLMWWNRSLSRKLRRVRQ